MPAHVQQAFKNVIWQKKLFWKFPNFFCLYSGGGESVAGFCGGWGSGKGSAGRGATPEPPSGHSWKLCQNLQEKSTTRRSGKSQVKIRLNICCK